MGTTAKTLLRDIQQQLRPHWPEQEVNGLSFWLIEHYTGLSRAAILADKPLQEPRHNGLDQAVERLKQGEPIQYVVGKAPFFGNDFCVRKGVLIPRPETEELVNYIIERHSDTADLELLDVGTGSGCIAISLALHLPYAKVWALDVSEEALAIARENARSLQAELTFIHDSILEPKQPLPQDLDILVSNPPYIGEAEASQMERHVLDWEPHSALFVPDDNPLLFYKALAKQGMQLLKPGGWLYLEINEAYGWETRRILEKAGYEPVKVLTDMNSKDRFVKGQKPLQPLHPLP